MIFFFSSRRRHTRFDCDWSSDVCSSDLTSAEEALAMLEPARSPLPDLLLLDVRLRKMSGVELVRRLAEIGRLPPTIIISGEEIGRASCRERVEGSVRGVPLARKGKTR